jgi:hypothetical protein
MQMGKTAGSETTVNGKMVRTSVCLPSLSHAELEKVASQKKVSVAWVVREAVEQYLAGRAPLFSHED